MELLPVGIVIFWSIGMVSFWGYMFYKDDQAEQEHLKRLRQIRERLAPTPEEILERQLREAFPGMRWD